jgi:hypothetical protein
MSRASTFLIGTAIISISVVTISGCGYFGAPSDAMASDQYGHYAPSRDEVQAGTETVAEYNARVAPEQKIRCRRSGITGSHFRKTRCSTFSQRREDREEDIEAADQFRRQHLFQERSMPIWGPAPSAIRNIGPYRGQ